MYKIKDLLNKAIKILKENNIQQPELEAQIILAHTLNCDRIYLLTNIEKKVTENQRIKFKEYINLRKNHYPLSYITGRREFMGITFIISPGVFIPRQETEFLVEEIVKISSLNRKINRLKIADIGTGSGNIAVSLAKIVPYINIVAIDISKKSIELAKLNAKIHNLHNRIKFLNVDLLKFKEILSSNKKFDFIVSNPPYVSEKEFRFLQKEISWEPRVALYGGKDGLFFYKVISDFSKKHLNKTGKVVVELSYNNSKKVIDIFNQEGLKLFRIVKDYNGFNRVGIFTRENG